VVDKLLLPLSRTAQALLAAERSRVDDAELKGRVLARAQATLDGERLSGVTFRAVGQQAAAHVRFRVTRAAILLAAALGVAGLAAASVHLVASHASSSDAIAAPRPPATLPIRAKDPALAPRAAPGPEIDLAKPIAPTTASGTPNTGALRRPNAAQKYAIELGLLEPARTSSARGDYNAALAAIAKHQREFPNGQLAEEREALRVRALWGLGQRPAAEAAAAVFRTRYPRSGLLSWMKGRQAQ
jgi:hypothetical protein